MRDITAQIHDAGAELVVVGNGSTQQAGWFVEDLKLSTPVYTDPSRKIYEAVGARRGFGAVFHPGSFLSAFGALRKGFRQKGVQGDATQLGGVFVIGVDGEVVYEYMSRFAGDAPSVETVLGAAQGLTAGQV